MSEYYRFKLDRKPKYHLMTEFDLNNGIVRKLPYNQEAQVFYEKVIQHNFNFREKGVPCVEQKDRTTLEFSWVSGEEISDLILTDDNLKGKIEDLRLFLNNNFEIYESANFEFNLFDQKLEKINFSKDVSMVRNCDIDLILQNFIWVDGKMKILDLEWKVDSIPLDFLLWRSLTHINFLDTNKLIQKYFTPDVILVFEKIEKILQQEVSHVSPLSKFQFGKLQQLSDALKNSRTEADHKLFMFDTVVEENIRLKKPV